MQNQPLLGYNSHSCFASQQTGWQYENLDNTMAATVVPMWQMGADQSHVNVDGNWAWVNSTFQTQLRQGNWDWVTKKQAWDGIGGTGSTGAGTPQPIPNSLYLTAAPPFFGDNRWPWVDPTSGTTYTLPAKYCFEHNQMPTCLQNRRTTSTPAALSNTGSPSNASNNKEDPLRKLTSPPPGHGLPGDAPFSTTGFSRPGPDGALTMIVKARPCSAAARETDGFTTCIGIPNKRRR
jgi:hypothetical protein